MIKLINALDPRPEYIRQAAEIIKKGGITAFPTTCLYGLGADAFNENAVNRLFEIKKRPYGKPILVLIHDINELEGLARFVPYSARLIMEKFWPGRVTILFEAKETLPQVLTAGTGKIGVRLCRHPAAYALAKASGCPITGTSANLSGSPGCDRISMLDKELAESLDLILDAGVLKGGAGSTIVDISLDIPKILRQGAVPAEDITALFC